MLLDQITKLVAFYHVLLSAITLSYANVNASECKDMGYSINSLLCSKCDELKEFKLNKLEQSCRKCCIADVEEAEKVVSHTGDSLS
jgi:hypothetical protein